MIVQLGLVTRNSYIPRGGTGISKNIYFVFALPFVRSKSRNINQKRIFTFGKREGLLTHQPLRTELRGPRHIFWASGADGRAASGHRRWRVGKAKEVASAPVCRYVFLVTHTRVLHVGTCKEPETTLPGTLFLCSCVCCVCRSVN